MSFEQYFITSPFALVADAEAAQYWSGRPKVRIAVERLIAGFRTRPDSTVDVIWASFGAGKTHTLYYIANRLDPVGTICGLVEAPEQIRRFHDLYKLFMQTLSAERVAQLVLKCSRRDTPQNLQRAAQLITHGNSTERDIAIQWLCGEKPKLNDLRNIGNISARIDNDIAAVENLASVVRCLAASGVRVCMLIDEYQRIGKLPDRVRIPITSGLRTVISKNPKGFSLVLAISALMEKTALGLVPRELQTILGVRPIITLPSLDQVDALEFVKDRFGHCRPLSFSGDPFEPFTQKAVETCIGFLVRTARFALTPRIILQTLGEVFDQQLIEPDLLSREGALLEFLSRRDKERSSDEAESES